MRENKEKLTGKENIVKRTLRWLFFAGLLFSFAANGYSKASVCNPGFDNGSISSGGEIHDPTPAEMAVEAGYHEMPMDKDSSEVIQYVGQWISFFFNYSNYDVAESLNLKALLGRFGSLLDNQGGEQVESTVLSANIALHEMLESFQRNTFIHVYPIPIINREEAVFERLNLLMRDWHSPMASPYVSLFIYMDPEGEGKFSIKFQMIPSENMGGMETSIVDEMNRQMTGIYGSVWDAKSKMNEVIGTGLDQLQQKVKGSYFPDLTIWYDGRPYSEGQEIEMWSNTSETQLYAAKKRESSGNATFDIVTGIWEGSNVQSSGQYAYYTPVPGKFPLTFTSTEGKVDIQVKVKEGTGIPSLRSVLKSLVREVLEEKEKGVTDSLMALRSDSVKTYSAVDQSAAAVNSRSFTFTGEGSGEYSTSGFLTFNDDYQKLQPAELEELKKDRETGGYINNYGHFILLSRSIRKQIKVKEFLLSVVDDPQTFDAFIDDLTVNSGRLLARFALNALSEKDKSDMKTIILNFLNEQIDKNIHY